MKTILIALIVPLLALAAEKPELKPVSIPAPGTINAEVRLEYWKRAAAAAKLASLIEKNENVQAKNRAQLEQQMKAVEEQTGVMSKICAAAGQTLVQDEKSGDAACMAKPDSPKQ